MSLTDLAHRFRRLVPLVGVLWLAGWLGASVGAWEKPLAAELPHDHVAPHSHSPELAQQPHDHLTVIHHHVGVHQHGHTSGGHHAHDHGGSDHGHGEAPGAALDQVASPAIAGKLAFAPSGPGGTAPAPPDRTLPAPPPGPHLAVPDFPNTPASVPRFRLTERIRL